MRVLIVVAVAMLLPTAALADDAKPAAEKKICRQQENTGSLFSKRICHTVSEWAKIDARDREDARNFSDAARDKPNLPR
ncbi:hypothetical protein FPZ24_02870 [Sphingomonas panacisoli]|uniref:Uncharacterized protein n=1 Tax=Sphingomonas panacisoli TaxID=1813879 RepID=A0A5B8LEQ6_9SPHN|nr:hypothetical protein [Sphingomonas panacisoli]QDZ06543.1 hypothetical protein FPZ24_02870 [Sphingomonas panacisoli]